MDVLIGIQFCRGKSAPCLGFYIVMARAPTSLPAFYQEVGQFIEVVENDYQSRTLAFHALHAMFGKIGRAHV